ncbi:tRNA-2-methylthio-N(6)-dimethylallyladenosine synthase [Alphaproteobacteria bacterium]|nr:tRNA-2-methylthio-N(6)-dimethylallyladenosine synthase [Alphaproteobacteria bacterium]GHS99205.1 tRNA-2-methylthio-N(6)-dimethylallyladenosine synthase [Alphaproteobacteria bacterium]
MTEKLEGFRFFIRTYGCQMNFHDSGKMALLLQQAGMKEALDDDEADLVILNTCHIREKAKHKVYTELGFLKKKKDKRQRAGKPYFLAVGGCAAQAEGDALLAAAPFVDLVFGTQSYHKLPRMVEELFQKSNVTKQSSCLQNEEPQQFVPSRNSPSLETLKILNIEFPRENKFQFLPNESNAQGSAFLAIQEGCNKFCTYCVVPFTRGGEVSRPAAAILEEARNLAAQGVLEITLLGQNVNAYQGLAPDGTTRWTLARLLKEISTINGIQRLFYTSSHPLNFSEDLIQAHATLPKLMPFLHLPVQSGCNRILKAMNRHHTVEDYKAIIAAARLACPPIALCSDFIVGFPGETEEDFEKTLEFVKSVTYAQAFSFKYSPRPGTVACNMKDQIAEDVKTKRLLTLQDLLRQQQTAFNKSCVGRTSSVLFQRFGKKEGQILGKSEFMQSVVVNVSDPDAWMNTLHTVHIRKATLSCLEGDILE